VNVVGKHGADQASAAARRAQRLRLLLFRILYFLVAYSLASFATERPLRAYVDPGSGTLIWQTMVASAVGAAFYFRRLVSRFKSTPTKEPIHCEPKPVAMNPRTDLRHNSSGHTKR